MFSSWRRGVVAILLSATPAHAQVHYDVGALATFQQRFLGSTPAEGGGLTLDGHVAVFPLLRVGGYLTGEVSKPIDAKPLRELLGGGLRIKIVPPWPRGAWRVWFATGFGYVGLATLGDNAGGGGFLEVPVIVGASYRIRKPVVFLMELGGRFGFGFWGSYYNGSAGTDIVSVALSVGIGVDG
jgi:hypothetical protein